MCLPVCLYKIFRLLVIYQVCLCLTINRAYADETVTDTKELEDSDSRSSPSKDRYFEKKYENILDKERKDDKQVSLVEDVAAGVAALLIGLYGYYNDDRGTLTKIAYSATQTAGVVLISKSIYESNKPSLLLLTDKHLKQKGDLAYRNYQRGVVRITHRMKMAEHKQLAYTSGILSLIYGFNGYQEKNIKGLRNVFFFLSFNFLLVSTSNFYKMYTAESNIYAYQPSPNTRLTLSILPFPTLTYNF